MITCQFEDGGKAKLRHAVVDVIAIRDGKILLIQRSEKLHTEPGKWGLPGGYVDPDETIEQAAKRELLEETGHRATKLSLFTFIDDPGRVERQDITFVYMCEVENDREHKPDYEVDAIRWFDLNDLPSPESMAFDHPKIIKKYLDESEG